MIDPGVELLYCAACTLCPAAVLIIRQHFGGLEGRRFSTKLLQRWPMYEWDAPESAVRWWVDFVLQVGWAEGEIEMRLE